MRRDLSSFDSELQSLTDLERRAQAASHRLERSDRSVLDSMSGTFAGTLFEIAETAAPVTALTRTGKSVRGTVEALGDDVVVMSTNSGKNINVLRLAAIEALVEVSLGHHRASALPSDAPFEALLERYAEQGNRLALTLSSNHRVMGTAERFGHDQLVLVLDGSGEAMTVATRAIDQAVITR